MNESISIKLLVDCPEYIHQLAYLWLNEIGSQWIPNATIARTEKNFKEHLNSEILPMTIVAIYENIPVAMVSLRNNDGVREDLTPWLGSLVVHPDYRSIGIGEMLINVAKEQARTMGHKKLYLHTLDHTIPSWYAKLGWKYLGMDKLYQHPVTVMEIEI